ncbi:hypothetical protein OOU_Y34scaffold00719g22 [Pyricularia oryzae Y34]|uniref:Uncharacterized protein n=2 Tax=Pyricularia oryzae TaxID=318829 RepID=A0AA97PI14_PYRO3|nr:hypothetical protein OOU_Y34scaffold00719g22 [Pyricularia oryzae Y34]
MPVRKTDAGCGAFDRALGLALLAGKDPDGQGRAL